MGVNCWWIGGPKREIPINNAESVTPPIPVVHRTSKERLIYHKDIH